MIREVHAMTTDSETVLASFGATRMSLTEAQRDQLDEQGFLPLPGALDRSTVASLRARFDELVGLEGDKAGIEVHQEDGTDRLANLVDKDPRFDVCWNNPVQLAAVAHVLGWNELKLFSLNARAALPDQGHQALHTDWGAAVPAGLYQICNSVWMLDDFTADNGATRVVPGSHRWGQRPTDVLADPKASHPDQVLVLGEAGTCVVFNSHLWHSGTTNRTDRPRRGLHAAFVRREHTQQTVQRDFLRPETLARLSAPQRYLLEV
jgi:ectoine hydroxylase-related dioxygenase (phytanoyl-CoA dioxygenase family)